MDLMTSKFNNFSVTESLTAGHGLVTLVTGFYGEIPSASLEKGDISVASRLII